MDYLITADERARFKRCRRQWDFASPHRRDLEPVNPTEPVLTQALRDALAVYYYPGTWDWPHQMGQSLVQKSLERSLDDPDVLARATAIVDCYDAWAGGVDDFAPVRIDHDVQALIADPREPEGGLRAADGTPVLYAARVDLLAVDAADQYWVVRHLLVEQFNELDTLLRDEAAVAACWAWEQDYLSMDLAGTLYNEINVAGPLDLPVGARAADARRAVAQHEPSGGGRSIPQHHRTFAAASKPHGDSRIERRTAGLVRRTRIHRSHDEIMAAGRQLAEEARDMTSEPAVYPNPAVHCRSCEFSGPCLAMTELGDPEPLLASGFRRHPAEHRPRLGQATWGFGRGAAPLQ